MLNKTKTPRVREEKPIESTSIFRQAENLERETDMVIQNMPARTYWRCGKPFEEALIEARESYAMCYRYEKGEKNRLKVEYARKAVECFTRVDIVFRKWYKGENGQNVINKKRHSQLSLIIGELLSASIAFYHSLEQKQMRMDRAFAEPAIEFTDSDEANDVR